MRTQDILLPLLAIYAAILPSSGVQGERAQVLRRRQQDNTENHVTAGDAQNQVDNAENHVLVAAAPDNQVVVTPGDAQNQEDNAENHVLVAAPDNHDGGTLPYPALPYPTPYPTTAGDAQNLGSSISGGYPVIGLDGYFMVYLQIRKNGQTYICGGTLINPIYVLTAAHCMFDKEKNLISADDVTAIIGRHDRKATTGGEVFNVLQMDPFLEYNYTKNPAEFDFLILMLDDMSAYIPIELDLSPIDTLHPIPRKSVPVKTMGWGATSDHGSLSNPLLYADLELLDYSGCLSYKPAGGFLDDKTMLCAYGDGDGEAGACKGDSGGPLITEDGKQIGIVSFSWHVPGDYCSKSPGVFSRISYAADWINTYLRIRPEEDNSM